MCATLKYAALYGFVVSLPLALASPILATAIINRQDAAVSANDWDPILIGEKNAQCSDLAVIFARGTFDKGNLGPWVGGPFRDALLKKSSDVKIAVQGVSPDDYPADLAGYTEEGGSDSCARGLGTAVQTYASRCPDSKIAIWGWSQGALCAHKAFGELGDAASNVIALGVFGDPISAWRDTVDYPAIPKGTALLSYCETLTPDPLCTNPAEDFPRGPVAFIERLKAIWREVDAVGMNAAQKKALAGLLIELPSQAMRQLDNLATDILNGHIRRWMLTPQHFWYGIDGKVETAADDLLSLYRGQR
ncbi:carbohydrate esterase family 5 protein [Durotheca rogersii]|uniref:carbohydrate esterase family 5 protein n=1 Tax=Durotheca rogersii TaxID=419775 RepID=UPI002220F608|nr:carbohydrate esterase family 5 protein [Durotheca rogersii]KAI5859983.1 carbohydrate esterase family 5 protein [Durotheca rogersii]